MSVCVLTSIGLALPGVVTGHLAVSSLRQSSVVAALGLAVKISILETEQQTPQLSVTLLMWGKGFSLNFRPTVKCLLS